MTSRIAASRVIASSVLLIAGCAGDDSQRYVVTGANQGSYSVKSEPNPMAGMRRDTTPRGPTTKEVEQQRRIEALEAQQRDLQSEIERMKREQGK